MASQLNSVIMSNFSFNPADIQLSLARVDSRIMAGFAMYAKTAAIKMQNYAKINRKWTDRTGDARRRLRCTAAQVQNGWKLTLAHGVPYGIYLELAHEKRFAIIQPTIDAEGPAIMEGFNNMMGRVT